VKPSSDEGLGIYLCTQASAYNSNATLSIVSVFCIASSSDAAEYTIKLTKCDPVLDSSLWLITGSRYLVSVRLIAQTITKPLKEP
jgi:hypothetical protein